MTKRDRLQVQVDTMEIRMNIDSHPLRFGPALGIRMREEGPDPLRLERFEEKVSLLLQHITVRWRPLLHPRGPTTVHPPHYDVDCQHRTQSSASLRLLPAVFRSRWDLIDLTRQTTEHLHSLTRCLLFNGLAIVLRNAPHS